MTLLPQSTHEPSLAHAAASSPCTVDLIPGGGRTPPTHLRLPRRAGSALRRASAQTAALAGASPMPRAGSVFPSEPCPREAATALAGAPPRIRAVASQDGREGHHQEGFDPQWLANSLRTTNLFSAAIKSLDAEVVLGGGQDAMDVTMTDRCVGKFEDKFYHKISHAEDLCLSSKEHHCNISSGSSLHWGAPTNESQIFAAVRRTEIDWLGIAG